MNEHNRRNEKQGRMRGEERRMAEDRLARRNQRRVRLWTRGLRKARRKLAATTHWAERTGVGVGLQDYLRQLEEEGLQLANGDGEGPVDERQLRELRERYALALGEAREVVDEERDARAAARHRRRQQRSTGGEDGGEDRWE